MKHALVAVVTLALAASCRSAPPGREACAAPSGAALPRPITRDEVLCGIKAHTDAAGNYLEKGVAIRSGSEDVTDPDLIRKILDHRKQRAPPRRPPARAKPHQTTPDLFVER